jgi:hypothetical protein
MVVSCDICGKTFNKTSKGYKAEWYLKSHKNNCFRVFKKKQRKFIKDFSINASDIEINRVYMFLQNQEQYLEDNTTIINKKLVRQEKLFTEEEQSLEDKEDDNCLYEKEYLHDEISEKSCSDDEYYQTNETQFIRPPTPELKEWFDKKSNLKYFIDNDENVYYHFNKTLLGKRYLNLEGNFKINFI